MTGKTRYSLSDIEDMAMACLTANGCDQPNARALAQTMTAAERDGSAGHGLFRMPGYIAALRSGKVDGKANPTVERVAPGALRVDAHGGFAPLALEAGREPLIEAAREQGVAMLGIVRCHHFAALWVEVEPLAAAGLCAMACTAYMPAMAPAGGGTPLYGTNPFAFGWPRKDDAPPMVFDMASAAMARGEIMVAARDGHTLPEGIGLDKDGQPTTDPQAIIDGGVILPFGGYKGSNIAMMVELLAAGLIGERFSYEAAEHDNKDGGPPRGGEFILAIDPSRLGGDNWREHGEDFFARFLAIDGTRLPASRRYDNRAKAERDGVDIPDSLRDKILELTKAG
jgi:delta1-piperideine-2-carboxylate reductase